MMPARRWRPCVSAPRRPLDRYRPDDMIRAPGQLQSALDQVIGPNDLTLDAARDVLSLHFEGWSVVRCDGKPGLVTAYYEPDVRAALSKTSEFSAPLHRRPPDLVDLDDENRPAAMDRSVRFGRRTASGIGDYFDRGQIMDGALDGQGLELAWLRPVDAFFVHIQGSARLRFADATTTRVGYDGKSGHRFSGITASLLEEGALDRAALSMQGTRAWLNAHPERQREVMARNRSYIFFREITDSDPALGPFGAAGCQLTAGRSIAVDKTLWRYGTPFYVDAPGVAAFSDPFRRLMVAQDTGSAITGAARADLFIGSGDAAGERAGGVKEDARFWVLWPKGAVAPGSGS